jgi:hypothetical protein
MAAFKDRIRRGLPVVIVGAAALLLGRLSVKQSPEHHSEGVEAARSRTAGIAR